MIALRSPARCRSSSGCTEKAWPEGFSWGPRKTPGHARTPPRWRGGRKANVSGGLCPARLTSPMGNRYAGRVWQQTRLIPADTARPAMSRHVLGCHGFPVADGQATTSMAEGPPCHRPFRFAGVTPTYRSPQPMQYGVPAYPVMDPLRVMQTAPGLSGVARSSNQASPQGQVAYSGAGPSASRLR